MLALKNINIFYGKLHILWDLSLEVGRESVGLFGPNGAGKTTLINAVLGLVKPVNGGIEFEGDTATGRLQTPSDGLGGQGGQYDMPAVQKDDGLGAAAARHVDEDALAAALLDHSLGGGGTGRGHGDNAAHGEDISEPDVDQFNGH